MRPPAARALRVQDLPVQIGEFPAGATDSVLDVAGVGLGHYSLWQDGPGPADTVRSGVTVLDLGGSVFREPVPAGGAVLNGAGEMTGLLTANEWGIIETPVFLTSTMRVGSVFDAACRLLAEEEPSIRSGSPVIPVVAECDDSWLSDPLAGALTVRDVQGALQRARASAGSAAAPPLGAVGAGTGMTCFGYKGGIGSASRVLPDGSTVAAVVLANFGERRRLTVGGVPVGRTLPADPSRRPAAGSCIVIIVTDGALDASACRRLAGRCSLGLARVGSTGHHGSGEVFLALATGLRAQRDHPTTARAVTGSALDAYFAGAVEASEAAVLSALLAAPDVRGRSGRTSHALPIDDIRALLTT